MKEYFESNKKSDKRKSEPYLDEHEDNIDIEDDSSNSHTLLRRKVAISEITIRILDKRICEQERSLVANTTIITRAMAKT